MHDVNKTSDPETELISYFDALKAAPVVTPPGLKSRILQALPDEPGFDVLSWLLRPWWRPALTAAAPLVLGFAMGFLAPLDTPPADDGDWLVQAAFGQATTLEADDLTGDTDDAS